MSTVETPPAASSASRQPDHESRYVVQTPATMRVEIEEAGMQEVEVWRDVATVSLPKRSRRQSAVLTALRDAGVDGKVGQRFRVLDAEAAGEVVLREKPLPPVEERFEVVSA